MLQGYRTYIIAAITAIVGALAATDWVKVFDDPKAGAAMIGMSVLMAVMRSITSTAPGQKS